MQTSVPRRSSVALSRGLPARSCHSLGAAASEAALAGASPSPRLLPAWSWAVAPAPRTTARGRPGPETEGRGRVRSGEPEPAGRELTCRPAQARLFDEPQLASLCLENIDKNTADAIAAEGFTDIDRGEAGAVGAPLPLPLPQPGASACAASPATGFCLAHLTLPPSVTGRATGAARSWRDLRPQRGQRPCVLHAAPWLGPRRPR